MSLQPDAGTIPEFTIGDRLRKARELTRLSATDFGAEIGVSRNTISRAESGDTKPRRTMLMAWSMRTRVPMEWLETGAVDDETPPPGAETGSSDGWAPRDSNPEPID